MTDELLARAAAHMVKFPHHDLVAALAKALREAEHWSAEYHQQLVNIACALGDGPTGEGDTASIVSIVFLQQSRAEVHRWLREAQASSRALRETINALPYCPYCGQGHAMHTAGCKIMAAMRTCEMAETPR